MTRRFARFIGSGLIAAAVAAGAPGPARAAAGAPAPQIAVKRLANGLTVLVWPDHDIPNVALYDWFRVGSRNERPGITGLSHFFEHMMFNGSAHYRPGEFDRVMERWGGANNAYTSSDVTVYQDWFPRSALDLVFRLEADRICCLAIDSAAVESERGVVYSERRTTVEDDNAGSLDEQVQATAFVAHPYQIPTIGWPSDIERWTIGDLRGYFRTYYAPNNATLVVVGDVTPKEIFDLAEKYLGPIPAQPPPPPVLTVEPVQLGERRVTLRRPAQVPLLEAAFHVGSADAADAEATDLLVAILSDGESSRLYSRLVDADRVAIDVSGWLERGFDPGLLKIMVTVSPEKGVAAAEASLLDELAKVARGVTEAELQKAKTMRLASHWRAVETIDGKAEALGSYQVFRGDYRKLFTAPERYARVSRGRIAELARRILDERNRTLGVLLPESEPASPAAGKGGGR